MDWFRNILIVAIAACGWLMIVEWQKDYSGNDVLLKEATADPGVIRVPTGVPGAGVKDIELGGKSLAAQEDLPSFDPRSLDGYSSDLVKPEPVAKVDENQLVKVVTDVYELYIDPYGGDIVKVGLLKYPISLEHQDVPFLLFQNLLGKKYIAQSGLVGVSGTDLDHGKNTRPLYQTSKWEYKLSVGESELSVPFIFENDQGVEFVKTYRFFPDTYEIKISFNIKNKTDQDWLGRFYGRIIRNAYGDPTSSSGFGMQTFLGGAYLDEEKKFKKIDFDDIDDAMSENRLPLNQDIKGGWIAFLQHYFLTAFIPEEEGVNSYKIFSRKDFSNQTEYILEVAQPPTRVESGAEVTVEAGIYVGPKIQKRLKEISTGLNLAVDYGYLFFISDVLFWILSFINDYLGNWGWSIIVLTFIIKAFLYPLSAKSYRSMAQMRKVQPKLLALREEYGDDKQKMSQELMKLYQKEKINPLGGCWPMLVQMPIFIALYWTLLESVELRQAPFIFWIKDLAVMDPLFVLPVLMGASMWFQQRMHPEPPDPMQAKIMKWMPVFMTALFLLFPSGLVLYWVTNNFLSILQQWFNTRNMDQQNA